MKEQPEIEQEEATDELLKSIRLSNILIPTLLGVGVVGYLFWRNFSKNQADLEAINWNGHVLFWVTLSFLLLLLRHLAYATRLRILSQKQFDWKKCIELIFIWEFSSAISPTSVGGSAVALVVLAQEKLSTAKTTTIVLYSAILDTMFFIGTLPILFFLLGPIIIRPGLESLTSLDGWGYTFIGTYLLMLTYGSIFFYGLFINPRLMQRLLKWVTSGKLFGRWRKSAIQLGNDFIVASQETKQQSIGWHIQAFLATATAWSCRFLLLNCLIIAFVSTLSLDFWSQFELYGRLETMFVIIAFSPTPGAAGFAELVFWGFVNDYVPSQGLALIIATIWRLFTYYMYLFVGAIIIPNWVRKVLNRRKKIRAARKEKSSQEPA